jgi:hypothetical protein
MDRRNKTALNDAGLQRMVVNNNFSGEKMGTSQTFFEAGQPVRQPASHNVQLLQNPRGGYQFPDYQQKEQQQTQFG